MQHRWSTGVYLHAKASAPSMSEQSTNTELLISLFKTIKTSTQPGNLSGGNSVAEFPASPVTPIASPGEDNGCGGGWGSSLCVIGSDQYLTPDGLFRWKPGSFCTSRFRTSHCYRSCLQVMSTGRGGRSSAAGLPIRHLWGGGVGTTENGSQMEIKMQHDSIRVRSTDR